MVELRVPSKPRKKVTRFIYDNEDYTKANFLGIVDEFDKPTERGVRFDPAKVLAAYDINGRIRFPTERDIIEAQEVVHNGEKAWYFICLSEADYIKRLKEQEKPEQESQEKDSSESEQEQELIPNSAI